MKTMSFNANNLLEASTGFSQAAKYVRKKSKPVLVEANTFRLRGHEEASGTKYYPRNTLVIIDEVLLQKKQE